jgi:hypothetical protein
VVIGQLRESRNAPFFPALGMTPPRRDTHKDERE